MYLPLPSPPVSSQACCPDLKTHIYNCYGGCFNCIYDVCHLSVTDTATMNRYITILVLLNKTVNITTSASFWDNFLPPQSESGVERNTVSHSRTSSGGEDLQVLDYQSPGSTYGLIHNVLGTNRRAKYLSQSSSWNKNDVWLEDGDLLVLKGGVLSGNRNIRDKSNIYSRPTKKVKQNFPPGSRVIFRKKAERRSDRGFETRFHPVQAQPSQDQYKVWLRLLGLNLRCFMC